MDVQSPLRLHGNRASDAGDPIDPGDLVNLRTLAARLQAALDGLPAGGTATEFVHVQQVPATEWVIRHRLGRHPDVLVLDTAGTEVEVAAAYPDADTVVITSAVLFAGTAYLH